MIGASVLISHRLGQFPGIELAWLYVCCPQKQSIPFRISVLPESYCRIQSSVCSGELPQHAGLLQRYLCSYLSYYRGDPRRAIMRYGLSSKSAEVSNLISRCFYLIRCCVVAIETSFNVYDRYQRFFFLEIHATILSCRVLNLAGYQPLHQLYQLVFQLNVTTQCTFYHSVIASGFDTILCYIYLWYATKLKA